MQSKYRINIILSKEDNCYLVELPEFAHELQRYSTHASGYLLGLCRRARAIFYGCSSRGVFLMILICPSTSAMTKVRCSWRWRPSGQV
jgi:hypothetical protein